MHESNQCFTLWNLFEQLHYRLSRSSHLNRSKWSLVGSMAPHSSTLAWKIPWMEEPGRLQSMGSLRVGHDWTTSLHFSLSCIGEGNGNPLQCSCLENLRDGEAWLAIEHSLALPFLGIGMKTDLFQSCGHCWVFQICWLIDCSTFTASSFRIWNDSTGISSPPLTLFVVMLPKAHLTSHSKISHTRRVITPPWLSGS